MSSLIPVLNCGSSSIKFALFDGAIESLPRRPLWSGKVDGIGGTKPTYVETGAPPVAVTLHKARPYHAAHEHVRARVEAQLGKRRLGVVAHRVVHGGSKYSVPARIDAAVLADLRTYIPLAPQRAAATDAVP